MTDWIIEGTPDKEVYNFLDELRNSGETNMFGARPYIVEMFNCSQDQATTLLSNWMKNYGK